MMEEMENSLIRKEIMNGLWFNSEETIFSYINI